MDLKEFQNKAARTINWKLTSEQLKCHAALGCASEAGEIAAIVQKFYQGHEIQKEKMAEEIGDCLWFLAETCTAFGLELSDVAEKNIEKLNVRYSGEGFTEKESLRRVDRERH